ncbi:hypothetical protein [Methylohalobius crimeensis]|uniref:hypothetical protein n=1 Tax=Methylohalobius crimeensis TaxID=244365 RepID=UPI0003B380A9|nr:hypothetical protein [Methylohalobius crimeensis]
MNIGRRKEPDAPTKEQKSQLDEVLYQLGEGNITRDEANKRRAVMTLLDDEAWAQWSNVQVAKQCGVSEYLVRSLRFNRSEDDAQPRNYTTKHGTEATMNTANIGRRKEPDTA